MDLSSIDFTKLINELLGVLGGVDLNSLIASIKEVAGIIMDTLKTYLAANGTTTDPTGTTANA